MLSHLLGCVGRLQLRRPEPDLDARGKVPDGVCQNGLRVLRRLQPGALQPDVLVVGTRLATRLDRLTGLVIAGRNFHRVTRLALGLCGAANRHGFEDELTRATSYGPSGRLRNCHGVYGRLSYYVGLQPGTSEYASQP